MHQLLLGSHDIDKDNRFAPFENYVRGLWKIGGLPLVLVGLGVANLFYFPESQRYTEAEQMLVSVFLFLASVIVWGTSSYLAFRRWQFGAQIVVQQNAKIIEMAYNLIRDKPPHLSKEITQSFAESISTLIISLTKEAGPADDS